MSEHLDKEQMQWARDLVVEIKDNLYGIEEELKRDNCYKYYIRSKIDVIEENLGIIKRMTGSDGNWLHWQD